MTADSRPLRAAVVYESMYGNTHAIASAIAQGLDPSGQALVVPVALADRDLLDRLDLVVIGGPTHAHGLSRPSTRKAAGAPGPRAVRPIDGDAPINGPGLREWLDGLDRAAPLAAAFDTRVRGPITLTGRASAGIQRRLRRAGAGWLAPPRSFFVTKSETLVPGEEERARHWGAELAALAGAQLARRDS